LVSKRDLLFISGEFDGFDLPKEKNYLFKYFRKDIQQKFVRYFFAFNDFDNFVDHTGLYCQKRWLKILYNKLLKLESLHKQAKSSIDLETLLKIESGKYKIRGVA
jgi:hypothetical protein